MPDYSNGKVYKLINDVDEKIYVGSTTQSLAVRKGAHKRNARRNPERTVYAHINAIGWSNVRIILIENVSCQNSEQLRSREQHYIDLLRPELNRIQAHVHCPHGRRHDVCVECNGAGICEHNRRRNRCVECGGSQICEHDRIRSRCVECDGASICEHNRRRNQCRDCGGASICEHGRRRAQCIECNGNRYHCECCERSYASRNVLNRHLNSISHITNFIQS